MKAANTSNASNPNAAQATSNPSTAQATSNPNASEATLNPSASEASADKTLNAQKVDGAITSEENGSIAFRKAPWNDAEVICEEPKVIPGRMVFSGERGGDQLDFKPYLQTGEKLFKELLKTKHAVVRTTKRTVQVNYTFTRDLDKQDMLRYLKGEHKELLAGFKELEIK